MTVHGRVAPGFEPVRDAFARNFSAESELGAAVHVVVAGSAVVDLWGGWADLARSRPWQADTLVNSYSVGKGIVSALLLRLVDAGVVGLDDPVAAHWPEFGAHGKERATVRHALTHRAGVPAIREPLTDAHLRDFSAMCDALAATEPWYEPGRRVVYHTNTFGHLVGGLLHRLTGRLPGAVLRDFAGEIGADVHVGVADSDLARCAEVDFDSATIADPTAVLAGLEGDELMTYTSYVNPPGYSSMGVVNEPWWRRAQVPSTNGHMTARGVARFYAALGRGDLISAELLAEAARPQASGRCPTLGQHVTFGLGLQPWTRQRPLGQTPGGLGHFGTGGSLGFWDPSTQVAFGYVMNHVIPRWQSPRNKALVDAVYASL